MCVESLRQPSAEHCGGEDREFACKCSQTTRKIITGNKIKADVANRLVLLSARVTQLLVSLSGSCGHKLSWVPRSWGVPCSALSLSQWAISTVSLWFCYGASPARRRHQQQLLQIQWHQLLAWPGRRPPRRSGAASQSVRSCCRAGRRTPPGQ